MSDIFISYSRKDIAYARLLHKALNENGFETWIDWQDIPPSTEWLQEVYAAIEGVDTFIFILSASSALSDVCGKEIEHAKKNNKRIIPIVVDDVEPGKVHPTLAAINWIFSRSKDEFQPAIENLIEAIQTDFDWVKAHTRLQVRALEWERANKDKSFLLQGTDLSQAENWLAESVGKEPEPTLQQTRYIQASRQGAVERQRRLLMSVGAALVITVILGTFAVINGQRAEQNANSLATQVVIADEQREIAVENAYLAHIRELTAVSQQADTRFDIAMLLGLESFNAIENYQTANNLFKLVQKDTEVVRMHSHDQVQSIAISPNGRMLASGSGDGTLQIWDLETGQPLAEPLELLGGRVLALAFSPNGKILAAGTESEGPIVLWDTSTMEVIGTIQTSAQHLAFSPDSKRLAVITSNKDILFFDVATMKAIGSPIRGLAGWKGEVAFSPDGGALAAGFGNLLIIDAESQQLVSDLLVGSEFQQTLCVDFSPDGNLLASAGEGDNRITLWSMENLQPLGEPFGSFSSAIDAIAFSPDGSLLAAGSWDRSIILFDVATREPVGEPLILHTGRVIDLAFSGDGKTLFSSSEDGTIVQWDLTGTAIFGESLPPADDALPYGSLSTNGDKLAVWRDGNRIAVYETFSGHPTGASLQGNSVPISRTAFRPDGNVLASVDEHGMMTVWDLSTGIPNGLPRDAFDCGPESDWSCNDISFAFSPDGNTLASSAAGEQGEIIVWDVSSGQPIGESFAVGVRYINSLAFSPDGSTLAVGWEGGSSLYDVVSRQLIGSALSVHSDWTTAIAFSPDGDVFVSAGGGTLVFWDPSLAEAISGPIPSFIDLARHLAFSPDGRRLAAAGGHGIITLWDVTTMLPLGDPISLPQRSTNDNGIKGIAFSSDGNTLISVQDDGTVYSWDVSSVSWQQFLCDKVGRNFTQEEWARYFPDEPYRKTCEQWPAGK